VRITDIAALAKQRAAVVCARGMAALISALERRVGSVMIAERLQ
jgi:hypothetical protein